MPDVYDSATKIAADLAGGRYSSREIAEAYIARIEKHDRDINAVVVRRFEQALKEADAADAARANGRSLGPLHGVPITIKECFDFTGLPSTYGHPERATHKAREDAVTVARLRAAGAVVLGKTNVPKNLADWESYNDVYGHTRNPWDLSRSPGGSSGGSGAAMAAALSALELGSDIAGSIRVPSTFCGIYGHKPTFGVIPIRGGNSPDDDAAPKDIQVAGPLARSAADLELAFDIMAGPDVADGAVWRYTLLEENRTSLKGWRVAIVADDPTFRVDNTIRSALARLGEALAAAGATVDREAALPLAGIEQHELFLTLLRSVTGSRYPVHEIEALRAKAESYSASDKSYEALMYRGLTLSHAAWIAADDRRLALRRRWREFFTRYDAVICPVTTVPAYPHMKGIARAEQRFDVDGEKRPAAHNYFWIGVPSVAYLPATAIPIGQTPDGIPVGAQIIGPEFGDRRTMRLAQLIAQAFRGFEPPPRLARS